MYSLNVRDRTMIAHSFRGETFGPAQRLHGATYVVDATFLRRELDEEGLVVDIGRAGAVLRAVLGEFDYRNLDEHEALAGQNTTTEFLAAFVCGRLVDAVQAGDLGPGARDLAAIRVTLHESDVAWAAFEQKLGA